MRGFGPGGGASMNSVAKATEVEPGNAAGNACVRHNNDRAGVASRLLPGERQSARALRRSPAVSVSCVPRRRLFPHHHLGRQPVRAGAGLSFRDGVARAASRQLSPFRRGGDNPRRVFSFSVGSAAVRGRASSFVSRPLVNSFRHRAASSVVRVFVADDQHATGAFRGDEKIILMFG